MRFMVKPVMTETLKIVRRNDSDDLKPKTY